MSLASRVAALAGVAAREALRSRLVLAVLVAVLGVLGALAWGATGDGTAPGRLRAFLGWGASWIALTLSLSAAFLPASLAAALKDGRLVPVTTGPLPRELVPVAWWLGQGVVLVTLALLAHAALGGLALAIRAATPPAERPGLRPFLDARAVARALPEDESAVERAVEARVAELRRTGALEELGPTAEDDVRAELLEQARTRLRSAPRGGVLRWRFERVEPPPDAVALALRFRYTARDERGQLLPEGRGPRGELSLVTASRREGLEAGREQGAVGLAGRWASGPVHEVPVGVDALDGATRLTIEYRNVDERPVVVTFPEEGVALLYPAGGGFGLNVARAGLVLAGRLALLVAVGVAAAALIDGKLAALVALAVLVVGSGHEFLRDAVARYDAFGPLQDPAGTLLQGLLWLVPDLGRDDLAGALAGGLVVPWSAVLVAVLGQGLGLGGLGLAAAGLLFVRRELGAIR